MFQNRELLLVQQTATFFSICRAKRIYFCSLCWTHSFISSNILAATCCYYLLENGLEKFYVHTRVTMRLGEISKALLFCIQRLANANCMHKNPQTSWGWKRSKDGTLFTSTLNWIILIDFLTRIKTVLKLELNGN